MSYDKVGDVQMAQGDLAAALKSFPDGLAIRQRLAQSDPGNAGWQRDLSGVVQQGRRRADGAGRPCGGAEILFATASPSGSAWCNRIPGNASWQRDLSVSYDKIGDVQVAQGDLAAALKSFGDSLAIIERLAQSDAGNAGWQRDLSVRYAKIGDVQMAQGDLAAALKSYRDGLAIIERLAQSDPRNAGWQRDLSVSYDSVGDVQVAQGDLAGGAEILSRRPRHQAAPGAIRSWQRRWQRDLSRVAQQGRRRTGGTWRPCRPR